MTQAAHRVVAGYVTVETAVPGGRARVDVARGCVLPGDVPDDETAALVAAGLVVPAPMDPPGTGEGDAGGSGAEGRPARSARKHEWLAYARAVDPDTDGLGDLTKEELIDLYGGGTDG